MYDIHKLLGFFGLILLGLIAITGASYSFPEMYRHVVGASVAKVQANGAATTGRASADEVYRTAAGAIPGASVTVLTWPSGAKGTFVARERLSTDWSRLGDNYVYIDAYSARVLRTDVARRVSRGNRIMLAMAPLHYGTFGGHATRVLWILMGLAPGVLAVTGFLIWWNRVVAKKLAAARGPKRRAAAEARPVAAASARAWADGDGE